MPNQLSNPDQGPQELLTFFGLCQVSDTPSGLDHPPVHEMPAHNESKAKVGNNTNSNFQS